MRIRIPIKPLQLGIPLSRVNRVDRGYRAFRANGSNGKASTGPVLEVCGQSWIPICPKCRSRGEQ